MENAKKYMYVLIALWALFKEMPTEGGITALGGSQLLKETICWDLSKESDDSPSEIIQIIVNVQFGVLGIFPFSLRHSAILIFVIACFCGRGYFYLA